MFKMLQFRKATEYITIMHSISAEIGLNLVMKSTRFGFDNIGSVGVGYSIDGGFVMYQEIIGITDDKNWSYLQGFPIRGFILNSSIFRHLS